MRSPTELVEHFRAEGRKVTPQRELIFRILHDHTEHPTAESVHAAARAEMPSMSLRTVYQTLNDLVAMGELGELDVGTGASRFDPNISPHHHLVCRVCGRVRDVSAPAARVGDVGLGDAAGDFVIDGVEITFRGVCRDCT